MPLEVANISVNNKDVHDEKSCEQNLEPEKMGFTDVIAFMIAAFQILVPYLLIFILAILLVPTLFYLISYLTGR